MTPVVSIFVSKEIWTVGYPVPLGYRAPDARITPVMVVMVLGLGLLGLGRQLGQRGELLPPRVVVVALRDVVIAL